MSPGRIAELLAPFLEDARDPLTAGDLDHISIYIDILSRWNARMNLTAIRQPEEIVTRHFGESLFAARNLFPRREFENGTPAVPDRGDREKRTGHSAPARTLADIGSGAGFPGIPIKLWRPDLSLTLIESSHKKGTFLREVARALTLTDVDIITARAESLPPRRFDVVTLRAVERFEFILPIAAELVAPGGRLALLIAASQLDTVRSALGKIAEFEAGPVAITPIPRSLSRVLALADRSN